MLDDKGRLFGKLNIVDLFVIIIIIAAVAFGGYTWIKHKNNAAGVAVASKIEDVYVTVDCKGYTANAFSALQASLGARCVAKNAYVDGTIYSVANITDSAYPSVNSAGQFIQTTNPAFKDGQVTIKSQANPADPIIKIAGQECRVGIAFYVKTNGVEMSGRVTNIVWGKQP